MNINTYAVYNVVAETFAKPMYIQTDAEAERAFLQACLNKETSLGQFPDDYALFKNGSYNDDNGMHEARIPQRMCTGLEVLTTHRDKMQRIKNLHNEIDNIATGTDDNG